MFIEMKGPKEKNELFEETRRQRVKSKGSGDMGGVSKSTPQNWE